MRTRLRSFCVWPFLAITTISIATVLPVPALAQSDCAVPHGVAVPQVRGQVFDAFGIAVPFATVMVLGIHGAVQTTADNAGHFSFDVPSGHYVLKADAEGFTYSSAELSVGRNWRTVLLQPRLKVMLGFNGSYCPWVTTSRSKFQGIAQANLTHLKETARIKEADQSKNPSRSKKTPKMKGTSQTKESSETNATQK